MKDTSELRQWIHKLIIKYSKQLGIKPIPVLIFNARELKALDSDLIKYKLNKKDGFSVFNDKERHTYINLRNHKYPTDIIHTVVHELVHIKYPDMQHGSLFQSKVNDIIMK